MKVAEKFEVVNTAGQKITCDRIDDDLLKCYWSAEVGMSMGIVRSLETKKAIRYIQSHIWSLV